MRTSMKNQGTPVSTPAIIRLLITMAIACALCSGTVAQTPGGTSISNQASATYSDGTNSYSTVSNTVTVTVSNVSGLAITQAVIDVDNSGTIDGGDTDVHTNGSDVISANIAQNGSIHVLVEVSVNSGATAGQSVQVLLGDASSGSPSYDNQAADSSANEVRTVSTSSVNGLREARGDISASVVNDTLLQLTLTAPAGPVSLGSDITYIWQVANNGVRDATGVTLNGSTQVYIIAPIPARTVLKSGQSFPAGTLYTTSPLSTSPLSATWSSTAPSPLSNTTRIAFPVGATLTTGSSSSAINMIVTVNTGVDATTPIDEIGKWGRRSRTPGRRQ